MKNNILDLSYYSNCLERTVSIRQFFFELLQTLWLEKEEFSGKRPFGNSGWDGDLIVCLIKNGLIKGNIDEDGYLDLYDEEEFEEFVLEKIIKPLFAQNLDKDGES